MAPTLDTTPCIITGSLDAPARRQLIERARPHLDNVDDGFDAAGLGNPDQWGDVHSNVRRLIAIAAVTERWEPYNQRHADHYHVQISRLATGACWPSVDSDAPLGHLGVVTLVMPLSVHYGGGELVSGARGRQMLAGDAYVLHRARWEITPVTSGELWLLTANAWINPASERNPR